MAIFITLSFKNHGKHRVNLAHLTRYKEAEAGDGSAIFIPFGDKIAQIYNVDETPEEIDGLIRQATTSKG